MCPVADKGIDERRVRTLPKAEGPVVAFGRVVGDGESWHTLKRPYVVEVIPTMTLKVLVAARNIILNKIEKDDSNKGATNRIGAVFADISAPELKSHSLPRPLASRRRSSCHRPKGVRDTPVACNVEGEANDVVEVSYLWFYSPPVPGHAVTRCHAGG